MPRDSPSLQTDLGQDEDEAGGNESLRISSEGEQSSSSLSPRDGCSSPGLSPSSALAAAYAARLQSEADYARYKVRVRDLIKKECLSFT